MECMAAIIGPTAVGKTALSIKLAKMLDTEIISGDSMLVYKGMDIGTAKPTAEEQQGVVHHLVDILEPTEEFSVTQFKALAEQEITRLNKLHKMPLLAGGTGLYVKSLVEDYQFNETGGDEAFRQEIEQIAAEKGREYVKEMLRRVNPEAAERLHINDFRRIVRALEVHHIGGEQLSQQRCTDGEPVYNAAIIGLNMDRARLYERINYRVELMVENGLVDEVRRLLDSGVEPQCQAMKGIGYKEIVDYLDGRLSLDGAVELIQKSTRHFAKRQLTWFRKMPYIEWYNVDEMETDELVGKIYKSIAGKISFS